MAAACAPSAGATVGPPTPAAAVGPPPPPSAPPQPPQPPQPPSPVAPPPSVPPDDSLLCRVHALEDLRTLVVWLAHNTTCPLDGGDGAVRMGPRLAKGQTAVIYAATVGAAATPCVIKATHVKDLLTWATVVGSVAAPLAPPHGVTGRRRHDALARARDDAMAACLRAPPLRGAPRASVAALLQGDQWQSRAPPLVPVDWLEDADALAPACVLATEFLTELTVGRIVTEYLAAADRRNGPAWTPLLAHVAATLGGWNSGRHGYIVMQHCGGRSLRVALDGGLLTLPQLQSVVLQLLVVLSALQGTCAAKHHDLYDGNVFLQFKDEWDDAAWGAAPVDWAAPAWRYRLPQGMDVEIPNVGVLVRLADWGLSSAALGATPSAPRIGRVDLDTLNAPSDPKRWGDWKVELQGCEAYDALTALAAVQTTLRSGREALKRILDGSGTPKEAAKDATWLRGALRCAPSDTRRMRDAMARGLPLLRWIDALLAAPSGPIARVQTAHGGASVRLTEFSRPHYSAQRGAPPHAMLRALLQERGVWHGAEGRVPLLL